VCVRMYVCVCICMCLCARIYVCVCVRACMRLCVCVCVRADLRNNLGVFTVASSVDIELVQMRQFFEKVTYVRPELCEVPCEEKNTIFREHASSETSGQRVCCSVLQYVSVCCSVVQCVALCWGVLRCGAEC